MHKYAEGIKTLEIWHKNNFCEQIQNKKLENLNGEFLKAFYLFFLDILGFSNLSQHVMNM